MIFPDPSNLSAQFRFDEPLDVDDVQEFHIARLLLLMRICGQGQTGLLRGRTKLAKLDLFVRYPRFLEAGLARLQEMGRDHPSYSAGNEGVEASMVRYRYGPWDHRYYNLLSTMSARGLIRIGGGRNRVETYSLTPTGAKIADSLAEERSFYPVVERCRVVAASFASFGGTELKQFVYDTFEEEVASLPQGANIGNPVILSESS
jgi:hypothetical protein